MKNEEENKKLSIYIHIPFCIQKCLYCDFLSAPADEAEMERYVEALLGEIRRESAAYAGYRVITIFIGGGTPSVLKGEWIEQILQAVYACYGVEADCEISMEANPGTITEEKLNCWRRAGINRLSIGLQSAIDEELMALGRIHSSEEFFQAYKMIIKSGFNNVNVDLMSAIPGQNIESCLATLNAVTALKPPPTHISAYSLIVEEGTPFYENTPELPDEDTERKMYKITHDILTKHGYLQYEISNYAKPGYECRHNQVYWRRGNYLGFGVGAASMIENVRFHNLRDRRAYVKAPEREEITRLSLEEQMEEFMFLGLRMIKGVSEEAFLKTFGRAIDQVYPGVVDRFCRLGLLKREMEKDTGEHRIALTGYGIDVSNVVMAEFLLTV